MLRKLSDTFLDDLKRPDGLLNRFLVRVKNDHTLMMAIRKNYINIYYRGGSLIKLTECSDGGYKAEFNQNYFDDNPIKLPKSKIHELGDVNAWINIFPYLKQYIDIKFSKTQKNEREFQQVIFRENNFSSIASSTEYFFSDIEYTPSGIGSKFRFDMLGVEWSAKQRKNGSTCRPVIVEMKYGDAAIGGTAGLGKHLTDISDYLKTNTAELTYQINVQMEQMRELGLIALGKNNHKIEIVEHAKPLVLFVLSNSNPRAVTLLNAVQEIMNIFGEEGSVIEQSLGFELRFFVANFSGYAMHKVNMLNVWQFNEVLKALRENSNPS